MNVPTHKEARKQAPTNHRLLACTGGVLYALKPLDVFGSLHAAFFELKKEDVKHRAIMLGIVLAVAGLGAARVGRAALLCETRRQSSL